jgi:chaperone BCS1
MQMASGTPREPVTLKTLSRDCARFLPLLAEVRDAALRGQEGRFIVHTAWGTDWHAAV